MKKTVPTYTSVFMITLFVISCLQHRSAVIQDVVIHPEFDSVVYFYYDYPWDNFSHIDDNILELKYKNGIIVEGCFWGNSDDFCDSREGFYPGFFVLNIEQIKQNGKNISFLLDTRKVQFFSEPIDIKFHSSDEARQAGYHLWRQNQKQFQDTVRYTGVLSQNKFIIDKRKSKYPYLEDHQFVRISLDDILKISRNFSSEKENRKEE